MNKIHYILRWKYQVYRSKIPNITNTPYQCQRHQIYWPKHQLPQYAVLSHFYFLQLQRNNANAVWYQWQISGMMVSIVLENCASEFCVIWNLAADVRKKRVFGRIVDVYSSDWWLPLWRRHRLTHFSWSGTTVAAVSSPQIEPFGGDLFSGGDLFCKLSQSSSLADMRFVAWKGTKHAFMFRQLCGVLLLCFHFIYHLYQACRFHRLYHCCQIHHHQYFSVSLTYFDKYIR